MSRIEGLFFLSMKNSLLSSSSVADEKIRDALKNACPYNVDSRANARRANCFVYGFVCVADDICEEWPHNFQSAPGYWIECSRQKITSDAGYVEESGSDDRELNNGSNSDGADGAQEYNYNRYGRARGSDSLLLEDDEYYPYDDDHVMPPPRYAAISCLRPRVL